MEVSVTGRWREIKRRSRAERERERAMKKRLRGGNSEGVKVVSFKWEGFGRVYQ